MSRFPFRRPVFRLVFTGVDARLHGPRGGPPFLTLRLDAANPDHALREIGRAVAAADGHVTVEMPASEVWSEPWPPGLRRIARRRHARQAAARALGLPPGRLAIATADPAALAAVPRATLDQTRRYLAAAGIPVAGFAARTASGATVPVGDTPVPPGTAAALAAIAVAAALFAFWPGPSPAPTEIAAAPGPAATPAAPVLAQAVADRPREPAAQSVAASDPPRPRAEPERAAEARPDPQPAEPAPAEPAKVPAVTKAARDLPAVEASRALTAQPPPRRRVAAPDPAPAPAVDAAPDAAGMRPMHRPTAPAADLTEAAPPAAPGPSAETAALAPRPREADTTDADTVASTVLASLPAAAAVRPEPRRAGRATPVVFTAQQPTIRQTTAPRPAAVRTAAPQQAAAPVRTAAVQTAAVQPAAVQPRTDARTRSGLNRNRISLVGVFGASDDRHALVRTPNGRVHKVRTGDRVDGARVAAVTRDGVHLSGRGTNVVLTLP